MNGSRITLFLIAFSFAVVHSSAQSKIYIGSDANNIIEGAKMVRVNKGYEVPSYIEFDERMLPERGNIFDLLSAELNLNTAYEFQLKSSKIDHLGVRHDRYNQFYNGIKVYYTDLTLHLKDDEVLSVSGNFNSLTPEESSNALSFEEAEIKSMEKIRASEYFIEENEMSNKSQEIVYLRVFKEQSTTPVLVKCFKVNVYAKEPLSRTLFFINTESGEVEFRENLLHFGNSKGEAVTGYSDTQNIITDSLSSFFRLIDTTRGDGVETYDCQGVRSQSSAVDFTDTNNFWNNFNANLDQYATDAHWGTEVMYDYLDSEHNYNSIDDQGFALKSYIHYGTNYVNAFWDGQRMTYGDGDATNDPLTTLDIVGHEIAHGLTEFSAGLIYAKESGALNESFSDIFGTALEFYARPSRANWTVGEDIGRAFRSMSNPKLYGHPDTYEGQNWFNQNCVPNSGNDQCGVHSNSGIQNRWFYLVAQGDTGVNDIADSFFVSGIGIKKAAEVSFRNLTTYLSASSNHEDARFYAIRSAIDLFGGCSSEVEVVTNAWFAVGVGSKYVDSIKAEFTAIQDTTFCSSSAFVRFKVKGDNVISYQWDFGNGDSSNLFNPQTFYDSLGSYNVQLIANGGACGNDTIFKQNYITLDTLAPCARFLTNDPNLSSSECKGRLYDSGGIDEDYKNNENGVFTIDVSSADFIELSFIDIDIEEGDGFSCNKDYLEVYDGGTLNSPLIGRFCKNNLPSGNKIISSSNQLVIRMNSDDFFTRSGFLLSWECKNASQLPQADFISNTDSSCTGEVKFLNKSSNGGFSYTWDFGDGFSSREKDPIHEYKSNGTYAVKLVVENTFGADSVIKSSFVNISRLMSPSASSDTFCLGANAGIKINSSEIIDWYTDTALMPVFTGDSITLFNIQSDTTFYIQEISRESKTIGGPLNGIGTGGYSNDNDYIEFDVHEDILLNSILFYSNRAGIRKIDVRNNSGTIIHTKEIYIPSSALVVTLDIPLLADTNYRISFSDRSNNVYKNTSGASFPYNISSLVTIKGTNAASGEYPYFYRWSVSKLSCTSNFKQVGAKVDSSCIVTSLNSLQLSEQLEVFPNPTKDKVMIKSHSKDQSQSLEYRLYSATGHLILEGISNPTNSNIELNIGGFSTGVYYLRIIQGTEVSTHKVLKID